jgi:hypothetical protein
MINFFRFFRHWVTLRSLSRAIWVYQYEREESRRG